MRKASAAPAVEAIELYTMASIGPKTSPPRMVSGSAGTNATTATT